MPKEEILRVDEDHQNEKVTVVIRHDSPPHNDKTFRFRKNGSGIELDTMNMKKGSAWTWSEEEIHGIAPAYELAKQEAEERFEYAF